MNKSYLLALAFMASSLNAYAIAREPRELRENSPSSPEIVKWVGEVSDHSSNHTTLHDHSLEFTSRDTGDTYNITNSPELVKLHHDSEKNYLVEIVAEKTPRFLFWGGNLIVTSFKVLSEMDTAPHLALPSRERTAREFGGSRHQ